MNLRFLIAVTVAIPIAASLVACGDDKTTPASASNTNGNKTTDDDERSSIGVPNPAADYCVKLGYTLASPNCNFPDGTSCDEWSFYNGDCGHSSSYCNTHGGQVSAEVFDAGSYTGSKAVCSLDGKTCDESTFYQTGKCE